MQWYLEQPLKEPVPYHGHAFRDYENDIVHIIQIGLGTYGTFIETEHWMDVLLKASSRRPSDKLKAIGVDPVDESAGPLEQLVIDKNEAGASVMLAAVGETQGNVSLFCLPRRARLNMRQELEKMPNDLHTRAVIDWKMSFLENMSSISSPHPHANHEIATAKGLSNTHQELMEKREVQLVTFADILAKHNCRGCEVLIIDAEGADCAIIRSMIHTCQTCKNIMWPSVIRFESAGHSGENEESTVRDLQNHGYLLLDLYHDATLVYGIALQASIGLREWADKHFSLRCLACSKIIHPSSMTFADDVGIGYTQWGISQRRKNTFGWFCRDCWCSAHHRN